MHKFQMQHRFQIGDIINMDLFGLQEPAIGLILQINEEDYYFLELSTGQYQTISIRFADSNPKNITKVA